MRAYSASGEEALLARNLLKDWAGEEFLTAEQYHRMEQETVCDLRRTNVFLRLVLFFFTVIIVAAAVGLFFVAASVTNSQPAGVFLVIFAAVSYAAAEYSVSRGLYRYGIEEGLAVSSIALLCIGIAIILAKSRETEFLIPAAGALGSLWIWHRFGFAYAFLAAMAFIPWLASGWTGSQWAQHLIVVAFYATGLIAVAAIRPRHRSKYLNEGFSIVEALLWFGIYVAVNLQLSSVDLLRQSWIASGNTGEFSRTFYWATWVLTWCIPPATLFRGVHQKDRFVIAVGAITAGLTLVTNKLYLGWERHTWDPMLLGVLLIGVALFLHRWLGKGQDGIRHGFTAQRLSGKDKRWMSAASVAFGLASSHATTPSSPIAGPDVRFGGGDSGGGGASSDF